MICMVLVAEGTITSLVLEGKVFFLSLLLNILSLFDSVNMVFNFNELQLLMRLIVYYDVKS